ncbi:MAG: MATE family efflux transporter [Caulobacter sp.]|nr:MATE family efflux transporter [Caulobacter sp.]
MIDDAMTTAPSRSRDSHVAGSFDRAGWIAESRAILTLAGPLVITQLAQMAILATDVVLLGRLSTAALAAAAIGNTVYYFTWLLGSGPAMAVSPMIAQLMGARPNAKAGVRAIVRMGLWAAVLLTLPLYPILLSTEWILSHLGQDAGLARDAGLFTAMLCFGLPFTFGFQVLRNFATAMEMPRAPLVVMLCAIVFNGLLAWMLIFGHLGAPKLGIVGAGIATSASAVFSFVAMLGVIFLTPKLAAVRVFRRFHIPAWMQLAEQFRLGVPIGLTMLFEAMLFNAMTLVVGTFGPNPLAAHQVALNFASVTFMVPLGVAMAATVRVGLFAGAGDMAGARRAGLTAMGMGALIVLLFGVAMALFGSQIAGLYIAGRGPDDLQVIALAAVFLKVAAAFQLFDALQVVAALALRGLKDARWPMIIAGGSYWLAGAPVCIALGVGLGLQGLGVWIGLAFGLAVAAVAMSLRFHMLTRPLRQTRD